MNEAFQHLRQIMFISGATCLGLVFLLLLLTVWRPVLRRLLDAEAAFWKRLGLSGWWTAPLRRFEESRALVFAVAGLLLLHLLLLVLAGVAYAHFAPRLRSSSPVSQHRQTP